MRFATDLTFAEKAKSLREDVEVVKAQIRYAQRDGSVEYFQDALDKLTAQRDKLDAEIADLIARHESSPARVQSLEKRLADAERKLADHVNSKTIGQLIRMREQLEAMAKEMVRSGQMTPSQAIQFITGSLENIAADTESE